MLSFGTAFASTNAMPDSPLYPLKKAIEAINKTISFDGRTRALKILNFNYERVQEIKYLQKIGDNKKNPLLMKEINQNIKEMNAILVRENFADKEELRKRLNNFIDNELAGKGKTTKRDKNTELKNKHVRSKVEKPETKQKKTQVNKKSGERNSTRKDDQAPNNIKSAQQNNVSIGKKKPSSTKTAPGKK
jgi:hypothetical protein